jgi:hypothetical protein
MTYVILDRSLFTGSVSTMTDSREPVEDPKRVDYSKVLRSNGSTIGDPGIQEG